MRAAQCSPRYRSAIWFSFNSLFRCNHGSACRVYGIVPRARPCICFFEMKVGDLAAIETISIHDLLELFEIWSTLIGRPRVRLVAITRGLTNTRARKLGYEQGCANAGEGSWFGRRPPGKRLAAMRWLGECARECGSPSESKSPRPVSRRGLNSCDDEHMQVICPTWQVFSWVSFSWASFPSGGDSAEDL
jgi:hypothetical protein